MKIFEYKFLRQFAAFFRRLAVCCGAVSLIFASLIFATLIFATGCGKYLPPLPPELLAPAPVDELQISADVQAVTFRWKAPERDERGESLKSINGYRIYRKDMAKATDLINEDIPYNLIGTVEDLHLQELSKLREAAIAEGRPASKVRVEDELKQFTFSDNQVIPGQLYAYQIVPFNQGDVEGTPDKIIRVLYRGTTSEIALIDQAGEEEEIVE